MRSDCISKRGSIASRSGPRASGATFATRRASPAVASPPTSINRTSWLFLVPALMIASASCSSTSGPTWARGMPERAATSACAAPATLPAAAASRDATVVPIIGPKPVGLNVLTVDATGAPVAGITLSALSAASPQLPFAAARCVSSPPKIGAAGEKSATDGLVTPKPRDPIRPVTIRSLIGEGLPSGSSPRMCATSQSAPCAALSRSDGS